MKRSRWYARNRSSPITRRAHRSYGSDTVTLWKSANVAHATMTFMLSTGLWYTSHASDLFERRYGREGSYKVQAFSRGQRDTLGSTQGGRGRVSCASPVEEGVSHAHLRYTGPRELPVLQDLIDGRRRVGGGRGRPVPHLRGGLVRPRRDPRADAGAVARRRGRRARGRSLPSGEGGEGRRPATRLERGPGPSLPAVRRAAASRRLPAHGGPGLPVRRVRRDARLPAFRGGPVRALQVPARPRAALRIPRRLDGGRGPGPDEPPARPGRRRGARRADPGAGPRSPGGRGVSRLASSPCGVRDPLPHRGAVSPFLDRRRRRDRPGGAPGPPFRDGIFRGAEVRAAG